MGATKLIATSNKTCQRKRVDPYRRLAPLEALRFAEEDSNGRRNHDDLPSEEDRVRKPRTEHRLQGQAGNRPVQHSQKGIGEETRRRWRWCGSSAIVPGESNSIPLNGFIRESCSPINIPPSIEANMKVKAQRRSTTRPIVHRPVPRGEAVPAPRSVPLKRVQSAAHARLHVFQAVDMACKHPRSKARRWSSRKPGASPPRPTREGTWGW